MGLTTGPLALRLMHHFEACRLKAYRCSAGRATIGWGMTYYPDGRPVRIGDTIAQAEADEGFAALLARDFEPTVRKFIARAPTSAAQFGALVAFAYNVGTDDDQDLTPEGLGDSTLLKKHLAGDYEAAGDAFLSWTKARVNGKLQVLAGLVRRRNAERALYLRDFDALAHFTNGEVVP